MDCCRSPDEKCDGMEVGNGNDFNVHIFTSSYELLEKLHDKCRSVKKQPYKAMCSSVFGGVILDPVMMVIPIDDHMVHRGHVVFDTAVMFNGYLYDLEAHLDSFFISASKAKISSPFPRSTLRSILLQMTAISECMEGKLRYWLSSCPGNFQLSPAGYPTSAFYAVVIDIHISQSRKSVKAITSTIPMKGVRFAKLTVEEAKGAAEMMYVGSTLPLLPIIMWDEKPIGDSRKVGELTMAVSDLVWNDMVAGPESHKVPVPYKKG